MVSNSQDVGTVKWYNPEKAYGFITTQEGRDLFVHRNSIADGRPWLIDGQGVEFVLREGQKGPEAGEVRVTQDVAEIPASRQRLYENVSNRGGNGDGDSPRGASARRGREPYTGPIPAEPVPATIQRLDPSGRFLFARTDGIGDDIYIHGSLVADLGLREGDLVTVTIEQSDRGLRARTVN